MRYGITPQQRTVFNTLVKFMEHSAGVAPTHVELRQLTGYSSRQVLDACHELQIRGWIDWLPRRQRSFRIVDENEPPTLAQMQALHPLRKVNLTPEMRASLIGDKAK